jgi:hypothetical protein
MDNTIDQKLCKELIKLVQTLRDDIKKEIKEMEDK